MLYKATVPEGKGRDTAYWLHCAGRYTYGSPSMGSTHTLLNGGENPQNSRGVRLLAVVHAAGITWGLARTWHGGRPRKRPLKKHGGASRCSPVGTEKRRDARKGSHDVSTRAET